MIWIVSITLRTDTLIRQLNIIGKFFGVATVISERGNNNALTVYVIDNSVQTIDTDTP